MRHISALTLAALLPLALWTASATAAPRPAASSCSATDAAVHSPQDVNDDGHSDLAVGDPAATVAGDEGAGAVEVRFGLDGSGAGAATAPDVRITSADLGVPVTPGEQFGAAVAIADVNGDACKDLVIGAPGVRARVRRGLRRPRFPRRQPRRTAPGQGLGLRLPGLVHRRRRTHGVGRRPGAAGRRRPERGGAVRGWTFGAGGTVTASSTTTEATAGVVGHRESGDAFGTALAMPNENTLVIGEPIEDVGRVVDAGTVTVVRTSGVKHVTGSVLITQDSPGVSGTVETGDHFGTSVSAYGHTAAVGVPGEDLGTVADAGMVHVLSVSSSLVVHQLFSVDENRRTITGTAERGDRFGTSVLLGGFVRDGNHQLDVAVGVPGKDVRGVLDLGEAAFVVVSARHNVKPFPTPGTQAQGPLYRGAPDGRDLGGAENPYDDAGTGLSALAFAGSDGSGEARGGAALVVAIPGDDTDAIDAGSLSIDGRAVRSLAGPVEDEHYGIGASTVPTAP